MKPTAQERNLAHDIGAALVHTRLTLRKERNVTSNEGVTPELALAIALIRSGSVQAPD